MGWGGSRVTFPTPLVLKAQDLVDGDGASQQPVYLITFTSGCVLIAFLLKLFVKELLKTFIKNVPAILKMHIRKSQLTLKHQIFYVCVLKQLFTPSGKITPNPLTRQRVEALVLLNPHTKLMTL